MYNIIAGDSLYIMHIVFTMQIIYCKCTVFTEVAGVVCVTLLLFGLGLMKTVVAGLISMEILTMMSLYN